MLFLFSDTVNVLIINYQYHIWNTVITFSLRIFYMLIKYFKNVSKVIKIISHLFLIEEDVFHRQNWRETFLPHASSRIYSWLICNLCSWINNWFWLFLKRPEPNMHTKFSYLSWVEGLKILSGWFLYSKKIKESIYS